MTFAGSPYAPTSPADALRLGVSTLYQEQTLLVQRSVAANVLIGIESYRAGVFSDRRRVVIEVDGKQHYADGDKANPHLYSRMVAEDRRLKLAGYHVFRFGGAELFEAGSQQMVEEFFDQLAERMK